jgi:hypothetical protein
MGIYVNTRIHICLYLYASQIVFDCKQKKSDSGLDRRRIYERMLYGLQIASKGAKWKVQGSR